jgi:hypothetical protein
MVPRTKAKVCVSTHSPKKILMACRDDANCGIMPDTTSVIITTHAAKTYWIETNSTTSMIMTTEGIVVWVGVDKWRFCMGQTIHKTLAILQRKEGKAVIRKTLPAHYLTAEAE